VILTETLSEEIKAAFKTLYTKSTHEEINNRDANELLVRSTGIPVNSVHNHSQSSNPDMNQSLNQ
jgi:hypothetical protein